MTAVGMSQLSYLDRPSPLALCHQPSEKCQDFHPVSTYTCCFPFSDHWNIHFCHSPNTGPHFLQLASVIIVTMSTQRLLPGTAEGPADHPSPFDRRNPPGRLLPSDPHLMPAERYVELNPDREDDVEIRVVLL